MTPFDFNSATPDEIKVEADRRKRARDGWNGDGPMTETQERRKEMLLEREVQQAVIKRYVRHGCKVRIYSQPRKAKYMTTGGADLQVFSPVFQSVDAYVIGSKVTPDVFARPKRIMWYHETKRPVGGRYSDDQLTFASDCREAGIDVLGGGVDIAQAQLDRLNIRIPE